MSTVSVLVVTYNRCSLLPKTVEGILSQTHAISNLVIFDNCSTDGTQEWLIQAGLVAAPVADGATSVLEKDGVTFHVVRSDANRGGAYGFSKGIEYAYDLGTDFIWVMDDDVRPEADCLAQLLGGMSEDVKACVPHRYGEGFEDYAIIDFDLRHLCRSGLDQKKTLVQFQQLEKNAPTRVVDMAFEGPLIASSVVEKIGYPNAELFSQFDDTEYAHRICQVSGINFIPTANLERMLPFGCEPSEGFTWKHYYLIRNEFWFDVHCGENAIVRRLRPLFIHYKWMAYYLKEGKTNSWNCKVRKRAYRDFRANRMGMTVKPGEF